MLITSTWDVLLWQVIILWDWRVSSSCWL